MNAIKKQDKKDKDKMAGLAGKGRYSQGEQDSRKTILTEQEFCGILTDLRDNGGAGL